MGRLAFAYLSTENLLHNVKVIREKVKPAKIVAMVKANAYGHGLRSVALRLDGHVDMVGVASIDEALALRQAGVKSPILLVEGAFQAHELVLASTQGFHVVFHSLEQVGWLKKICPPQPIEAWIKVNSGMGRLGALPHQVREMYHLLSNSPWVAPSLRVMSHLACGEDPAHPLTLAQIQYFQELTSLFQADFSLCASSGILHFPSHFYDYVRPGLLLYGLSPLPGTTARELGLKPVMTLQSTLIAVNTLPQGSFIGYGARYQCPEEMRVGVVALGYGDGYPFTARDGTPVLIKGVKCPLVGRVSMDMLTVDLRACPEAEVGDFVTLWGEGLPLEEVAPHTSNIPYDIVTGVQHRVQFLWTHDRA